MIEKTDKRRSEVYNARHEKAIRTVPLLRLSIRSWYLKEKPGVVDGMPTGYHIISLLLKEGWCSRGFPNPSLCGSSRHVVVAVSIL